MNDVAPAHAARDLNFAHGSTRFTLTLPASADELLDETAFAEDERLPYWADLWPSAKALARYLLDHPPMSAAPSGEVRAIELGCGAVALASLALATLGCDVLATDYEDEALASVRCNRDANRLGGDAGLRMRMVDWRDLPGDLGEFDLVLATDVMYEQRHALALAHAVPKLLAPGGRFILADPGRRYLPEFQGRIRQRGWVERELAVIEEPDDDVNRTPSKVRIIEFSRAAVEIAGTGPGRQPG